VNPDGAILLQAIKKTPEFNPEKALNRRAQSDAPNPSPKRQRGGQPPVACAPGSEKRRVVAHRCLVGIDPFGDSLCAVDRAIAPALEEVGRQLLIQGDVLTGGQSAGSVEVDVGQSRG